MCHFADFFVHAEVFRENGKIRQSRRKLLINRKIYFYSVWRRSLDVAEGIVRAAQRITFGVPELSFGNAERLLRKSGRTFFDSYWKDACRLEIFFSLSLTPLSIPQNALVRIFELSKICQRNSSCSSLAKKYGGCRKQKINRSRIRWNLRF